MKNKILVAVMILGMISCQNKDKTDSNSVIKTIAEDTLSKTVAGTADVSDAPAKEDKAVDLIRKQLNILLKTDLPAMTKDDRFFYYEAFDLNNDKKDEYFVGFSNPYFCGSGGCTGYILNNDGSVINRFTVTDFPILVATSVSDKFYDLIFETGGKFHLLKMKNGKYPSNPSVQEVWKGEAPKESTKVLDIQGKKLEKYSF
ncbi:hypothetical protein B0A67_02755 [Flavobacterium aquidurense]|jgi:hypothetical protein|uniref:hypothetical protein n=1 Tax=Flavobacterium aquidurense TaxID=362413 RepID=UPI00092137C4|nr:hypothetical protein [Flavobacterium aquidurense]OXA73615.1 hypothetical protein B0A67_02755 [Flavobacterium aquidurense]SHG74581.1 hypothetical protein SAMN05444481_10741 [Flavobacterium frigidimaris]